VAAYKDKTYVQELQDVVGFVDEARDIALARISVY
jgi:hypothetical protein